MAVSRRTLRLLRDLRTTVGNGADEATRTLARAWVRAWESLAGLWSAAAADAAALVVVLDRRPGFGDVGRLPSVTSATAATGAALAGLVAQTTSEVSTAASDAAAATAAAEPLIVASQYPPGYREDAEGWLRTRILPSALDLIVDRVREQITSTARPLSAEASEAMRRELVRGVALGLNPNDTARAMVARVQGRFEGGLARAITISRTETVGVMRDVSYYAHRQQADVLRGWRWSATLDSRTCPSCWALDGTEWPLSQEGPWDHQNGRCARLPLLRPWRDMGIPLDEPADAFTDAEAKWRAMSRADQDAAFGAARADLVRSGRVDWRDLYVRRDSHAWRPSYVPRTLRDLHLIANRRAAA